MKLLKELLTTPSPSGHEGLVQQIVLREIKNYGLEPKTDKLGNVWVQVGDEPPSLFTAHMDCVHNEHPVLIEEHQGVVVLAKDCKQSALGGDDKAGIRVLLHMLEHGVNGVYVFTVQEEVGCIGAEHAAKSCPSFIKHAICFDRRGTDSIITEMSGGPCCSEEFADALIAGLLDSNLKFQHDPTGSTTDTNKFRGSTLNHTNISIGYENEHTKREELDTWFVEDMMAAVLLIDWDGLPQVERPAKKVYGSTSYPTYCGGSGFAAAAQFAGSFDDMVEHSVDLIENNYFLTREEALDMVRALQEWHDLEMGWFNYGESDDAEETGTQ